MPPQRITFRKPVTLAFTTSGVGVYGLLSSAVNAGIPASMATAAVVAAMATGIHTVWTLDRKDLETYRLPGRKRFHLAVAAR